MRCLLLLYLSGCIVGLDDPEELDATVENLSCASGQWCLETSGTSGTLHGVYAASASDVFAVGNGGVIVRRVGGAWTKMTSNTTGNLKSVWGTSSSDVWAVGQAGVVVHYNGSTWSPVSVTSTDIDAVWCSSASDVWMAGTSSVWHSTDYGKSFVKTAIAGAMLSISGTSANDVWVTGENTYLHHYTSGKWVTVNPGAGTSTYFAVLSLSTTNVWTSDFMPNKETMHTTNGSSWTAVKAASAQFADLFAMSATDLWGVGGTKIGRGNGSSWTVSTLSGVTTQLWAVSGAGGNVWAVGDNGVIEHYTY